MLLPKCGNMYDKVKMFFPRSRDTPDVSLYLDDAKELTDLNTGEIRTFGSIDGLKVNVYPWGIYVIGSLPKYMYGNNICSFDRCATMQAIEKLSDALHIPMNEAKITGLEFGSTFILKQPVENYLSKLGNMPRLQRYFFNVSTLYYKSKNQSKVFIFYDKKADAKAKKIVLPDGFEDANLLRYEMRLDGRLTQQLKTSDIKASTLSERAFYSKLLERYQQSYFSISKINQLKLDAMSQIKTVTDAFEVFVARLISQGDETQITDFIDELKANGVFHERKNYTRLKKKIKGISTKASITTTDELIKELDDEIKNVGAYV